VSRQNVYQFCCSHKEFAAEVQDAFEAAVDALEAEAHRRAFEGIDEPVIYKGQLMGDWVGPDGKGCDPDTPGAVFVPLTIKRYSDAVLIFLLKGLRRWRYGDKLDVRSQDGGLPAVARSVPVTVDGDPSSPQEQRPSLSSEALIAYRRHLEAMESADAPPALPPPAPLPSDPPPAY
jgi:hypothetical protein